MKKRDFLAATLGSATLAAGTPSGATGRGLAGPGLLTVSGAISRGNRGPLDKALDQMIQAATEF